MAIVDYAEPWMMAHKALQNFHKKMLRKDYDTAIAEGMKVIVEMRLAMAAARHEQSKMMGGVPPISEYEDRL